MVKKRKCNKDAASFTPNSALPNVTALIRVLSVSGDEGVQPAQGAVVGADQGADDDTLPPVNLHPPLPAARPGEHLLHPLLLLPHPRHALHHPGAGGGEAEHVEGDVEGEVSLVGAGKGCHRVWPSVQTDWAELHPKATFTLTNAFHLLSIHIAHSQEIPIKG